MTPDPSTRRLLVVYCGGTFGMEDRGEGLEARTALDDAIAVLVRGASEPVGPHIEWELAKPQRIIDSAEADHGTALATADVIRDRCTASARTPFDAVLVVHGTDTLAHSAAENAFALADLETPIVFTGAQYPLGTPGGDAEQNFRDAFVAALREATPGVRIVFGGASLAAVRSVKRSSERFDAFVAHRAVADGASGITEALAAALAAAAHRDAPRVGLLTVVPGLPGALLTAALDAFSDGLVLECYGAGTAPLTSRTALGILSDAVQAGTPVLAITRCEDGRVDLSRYAVGKAMERAGVIGGSDLTAEAAVAKLRTLRRCGYSGERLRRLLHRNLIGEQTSQQTRTASGDREGAKP